MKPYFERDGVTIYHGDARDVLPTLQGETIVTDPVWPNAIVPLFGHDDPERMLRSVLDVAPATVIRIAVQIGCDSDPRFLRAVPDRFEFFRLCWLDVSRPNYKGRLLDGATPAYLFGEPPTSRPGRRVIDGMFRDASSEGKTPGHPCPRKPAQVRWILSRWTNPSDTVIDPFMGIGTTLLAAAHLEVKAIGIEIEERYCEIAAHRLDQMVMPLGVAQ